MTDQYVQDLEAANEKLQDSLTKAESLLLLYKVVEIFFIPAFNKHNRLVTLSMRLSYRGCPESIQIAEMSAETDEKNTWWLRLSNGEMFKVEVKISSDTVEAYVEWMMKALHIHGLPYIIKE